MSETQIYRVEVNRLSRWLQQVGECLPIAPSFLFLFSPNHLLENRQQMSVWPNILQQGWRMFSLGKTEPDSSHHCPSGFKWVESKHLIPVGRHWKSTVEKSLSRVRARPPEPISSLSKWLHQPAAAARRRRLAPPIFIRQKAKELLIYAKNAR